MAEPWFIRGSGGGGDAPQPKSSSASEAADNLISHQYAEVLDVIGEGEIEGWAAGSDPNAALKNTYLDGTPVMNADGSMNFSNVTILPVWGTPDQQLDASFRPPASTIGVGVEVRQDRPVARTITDPRMTAALVYVSTASFVAQNPDGGTTGTSVELAIDLNSNGTGYQEVVRDVITGKTTSSYVRAYKIDLTKTSAPWRIRVRRITPDSASVQVSNKIAFDSYAGLVERKFSYPHTAIIQCRFTAKEFSSAPNRRYLLKLLRVKVPQNYDPETRTYATTGPGTTNGIWDGTFKKAWTDNPAWCWYDIVTSERYGIGRYIATEHVDKFALYEISKYCDELVYDGFGGQEPRFTCNMHLVSRDEAMKVVVQMAGIFRSMAFWASGSLTLSQDKPAEPVRLFTPANVQDGIFNYVGTAKSARHTVAVVSWNDPENLYQPAYEYVEDAEGIEKYGILETQIAAIGCTSRGQARRFGRWLLLTEKHATEVVNFKVGLDAIGCGPGDVIVIHDPVRAGERLGGRAPSATATSITLDAPVTLRAGQNYTLSVALPDLTVEERAVVWNGEADQEVTSLTWLSPLPQTPVAYAVWVLASTEIKPELWRVIGMRESSGVIEVSALEYHPELYAWADGIMAFPQMGAVQQSLTPGKVGGPFVFKLSPYKVNAQTYSARLTIGWKPGRRASRYTVSYRRGADNWVQAESLTPSYDIDGVIDGVYEVRISSVGVSGAVSDPVSYSYTVVLPSVVQPGPVVEPDIVGLSCEGTWELT